MKYFPNILSIEVPDTPYIVPVHMFNYPEELITFVEGNGGEEWLEGNKTFVGCVLTIPREDLSPDIDKIHDYTRVLEKYPNSNRVFGRSIYLDNFSKGDRYKVLFDLLHTSLRLYKDSSTELQLYWDEENKP